MNYNNKPKYLINILNIIKTAMIVVDLSGKIIDCNNAVYDIFNYSCEELKNKTIYDLCAITPEILEINTSNIISSGIRKNNIHFFCEISIHVLNENKKEFLFVISDVHEREINKLTLQKAIEITASNLKLVMGAV